MSIKYTLGNKDPDTGLFRVIADRDFGDIKRGDIGGWASSDKNLSHDGKCWIYGNAKMYDDAKMHGNAEMHGNAKMYGRAIASISPISIAGLLWPITISDKLVAIGCKQKSVEAWLALDKAEVTAMDRNSYDFFKTFSQAIAVIAKEHQAQAEKQKATKIRNES